METYLTSMNRGSQFVINMEKYWPRRREDIGALTSVDKGKNITTVTCVSATGVYVPAMMIFRRVHMKPELLEGSA